MRETLAGNERSAIRAEERMRRERDDLMMKLQESESRHEELSGSLSSSTRPLLRQIESLQASLSEAQTNRLVTVELQSGAKAMVEELIYEAK